METSHHDQAAGDRELWEHFIERGCEECFDLLVQRYKTPLFNLAYRVLYDAHAAQDMVQAAFIRLLQRKTQLTDVESLRSWLHKTVLHSSLNMKRTTGRRNVREKIATNFPETESPREAAAKAEQREDLELAIRRLKDSLRIPIVLRYLQGLSHAETAEVMCLSSDAIRMRIKRGLKKLRKLLTARGAILSLVALKGALRCLPPKATPADLLPSTSSLIRTASSAGSSAAVGLVADSVIRCGLIVTAKMKIAVGVAVALLVAGTATYFATRGSNKAYRVRSPESHAVDRPKTFRPVTPRPPKPGNLAENRMSSQDRPLWGCVVDSAGQGVSGALVEVGFFEGVSPDSLNEKRSVQSAITDSDGNFHIEQERVLAACLSNTI